MNKFVTAAVLIFYLLVCGCAKQFDETNKCRSGFFSAKNNGTKIYLSKFCDNESIEIFCEELSEKANGKCQVKWYVDGKFTGELTTEYVDGRQSYEVITFAKLTKEFPFYTAPLEKEEWDNFSFETKSLIYYEASRERYNFNNGGLRYQYPYQLPKGQTIYDVIEHYRKYKNKE